MQKKHQWGLVGYVLGALTGGIVFSFVRGIFRAG